MRYRIEEEGEDNSQRRTREHNSDTCGASTPAKVGHTLHPRDNTSIAARIPSICSDRRVRSRVSGVQLQRHAEIYNFFSFNYEHQYFCSCLSID